MLISSESVTIWHTLIDKYRVIQKKLFHKSEEKKQEKIKMILQKNENLVHVQQQYGVSFCEKIDSKSGFF